MEKVFLYLLTFVEVLTCILLITVILMQKTKNQGAGGLAFGSGMGEQLFGAQAGNVLTRVTSVLLAIFLANTCALSIVGSKIAHGGSGVERYAPPPPPSSLPAPAAARGQPVEESVPVPSDATVGGVDVPVKIPDTAAQPKIDVTPVVGPVQPTAPSATAEKPAAGGSTEKKSE